MELPQRNAIAVKWIGEIWPHDDSHTQVGTTDGLEMRLSMPCDEFLRMFCAAQQTRLGYMFDVPTRYGVSPATRPAPLDWSDGHEWLLEQGIIVQPFRERDSLTETRVAGDLGQPFMHAPGQSWPPEPLLTDLRSAQRNIICAAYRFSNYEIARAIIESAAPTKIVLVDGGEQSADIGALRRLRDGGASVYIVEGSDFWPAEPPYPLMHHKFLVADGHVLWHGSANPTHQAMRRNFEDMTRRTGFLACKPFTDQFWTIVRRLAAQQGDAALGREAEAALFQSHADAAGERAWLWAMRWAPNDADWARSLAIGAAVLDQVA